MSSSHIQIVQGVNILKCQTAYCFYLVVKTLCYVDNCCILDKIFRICRSRVFIIYLFIYGYGIKLNINCLQLWSEYMRQLLSRDTSTNLGHWVHERIVISWREYQPGTLSTWENCYLVMRVPTWDIEYMRELLSRDASTNLGHWVHERIVNSWREYQPGTLSTWKNC